MRISDWSADVCFSDLAHCHSHCPAKPSTRLGWCAVLPGLRSDLKSRAHSHAFSGQGGVGFRLSLWRARRGSALSGGRSPRSEEHTSELQSLMRISYAVFCLKKKNNQHTQETLTLDMQTRIRISS